MVAILTNYRLLGEKKFLNELKKSRKKEKPLRYFLGALLD